MNVPILRKTAAIALYAGTMGGMLGCGGGAVLTPFWLTMNFRNIRVSATATFCVFFTSFSSFITYFVGGVFSAE